MAFDVEKGLKWINQSTINQCTHLLIEGALYDLLYGRLLAERGRIQVLRAQLPGRQLLLLFLLLLLQDVRCCLLLLLLLQLLRVQRGGQMLYLSVVADLDRLRVVVCHNVTVDSVAIDGPTTLSRRLTLHGLDC